MRMDKLPSRFQQSFADAQSLALGRDHQFLEPAHVMLALLDGAGGSVRPLLLKAGADVNKLRAGLLALLDGLPKVEGTPGDIHLSNDLNRVLNVTDKAPPGLPETYSGTGSAGAGLYDNRGRFFYVGASFKY